MEQLPLIAIAVERGPDVELELEQQRKAGHDVGNADNSPGQPR